MKQSKKDAQPAARAKRKIVRKPKPSVPLPPPASNGQVASPGHPIPRDTGARCMNANEVKAAEIDWLWEDYIPSGLLTLVTGESGGGKSTLLCALAAALSKGKPLGGGYAVAPGNTLIFCPEEEPSFIVKPRMVAHGADLERVLFGDYAPSGAMLGRLVLPADMRRLALLVKINRARMVIIDPITAYLGAGLDVKDDIGVRRLLEELQALAMETGAAVVITRHYRKSRDGTALDRVGGSASWTQYPRTVLACGVHPDAADQRVLVSAKPSLTGKIASIGFRIDKCGSVGKLSLTGPCGITADDLGILPADAAERDALADACAFLLDMLRDGERPSKEINRIGEESGLSRGTMRRAKVKVGVRSIPRGPNSERYVAWALPESEAPKEASPSA